MHPLTYRDAGFGVRRAAVARVNISGRLCGALESRRGAHWRKTAIVDHGNRSCRRGAWVAAGLRRFLEQLVLNRAGRYVIDQPGESDH